MSLKSLRNAIECALLLGCLVAGLSIPAQTPPQNAEPPHPPQAEVTVNGKALFSVRGLLSFSAKDRATAINRRIENISRDVRFAPDSVSVADSDSASDIMAGDLILMSVTDLDAQGTGETRQALARDYANRIATALPAMRRQYSIKSLMIGAAFALLSTAVLLIIFRLLSTIFPKLYRKLDNWRGSMFPTLRIQKFEILPADRIADSAIAIAKLLRLALVLVLLYFYISLVLGFFPWTQGYAQVLFGYVVSPIKLVAEAVIAYLPNVFFIVVIGLVSFYFIKGVRVFFTEIGKGTISFPNFYPDWAEPTFKIVRTLILALTVIAAFPYLPGSKSPAFQGISIFIGVLISLGSTSAVANIVAGVILTYMRAFKIGDRVKIADTMGDVIEKTLLVTRIRTIKNVEITIANAMVLSSHIVNFSSSAQSEGLILNTTVTIGYDAPWRTVHQLLIDAALDCENVLSDPVPFVFQTALDDFYVHYEINAYTDQPNRMAQTYSVLHQKIQDKFNQAGIEIMSSHYSNVRDGNRTTIPEDYLPKNYVAPSFRLGMENLAPSGRAPAKPIDQ